MVKLALIAAVFAGESEMALAADHKISAQTTTFECSSIRPGDTLTLASGTRGKLKINNCKGTSTNPIIVRNDASGNGPTVINRSSGSAGGFLLSCESCVGVAIDGSNKWRGAPSGKTYGIKVTMTGGGGPTAFVWIGGKSRFVTIRNVEVDGAWPARGGKGSGIRVNDHSVKRNANPGLWREGILIEHNYIHDVETEGMYVGPNYSDGDIPLRNIEIRYNRVEDIGWEGINTKSMWEGDNSIHHNQVRRAGKNVARSNKASQYSGIKNNAGTVKIYNNWVETTGQHGIQVWTGEGPRESEGRGPFAAHIWNNVIVGAGKLWRPFMAKSYGISIGAQNGCEKPVPSVYNNTIVNSRQGGIHLTSNVGTGFVRDNVVAGSGSNPVIAAPGFVQLLNNSIGAVTQMAFVDAIRLNFRLSVNSPGWNQGGNPFPKTDFNDVARPKHGAPDQGAFEGS
ncbi:MAG: choice-of-anchor Q domain-containing protein [Steroidobacteraceae bacterium]